MTICPSGARALADPSYPDFSPDSLPTVRGASPSRFDLIDLLLTHLVLFGVFLIAAAAYAAGLSRGRRTRAAIRPTRTVGTQAQTSYTVSLRRTTPRFTVLPDKAHGVSL